METSVSWFLLRLLSLTRRHVHVPPCVCLSRSPPPVRTPVRQHQSPSTRCTLTTSLKSFVQVEERGVRTPTMGRHSSAHSTSLCFLSSRYISPTAINYPQSEAGVGAARNRNPPCHLQQSFEQRSTQKNKLPPPSNCPLVPLETALIQVQIYFFYSTSSYKYMVILKQNFKK